MKSKNGLMILCGLFCAAVCAQAQVPQIGKGASEAVAKAARATTSATAAVGKAITNEVVYQTVGTAGRATVVPAPTFNTPTAVAVGGTKVTIPPMARPYMNVFPQFKPEGRALSSARFPGLHAVDAQVIRESLENSVSQVVALEQQGDAFYRSLRSEVFEDKVPYQRFLPAERPDYIYIGEVHQNPFVHREIQQLVKVLQQRYAPQKIYFATEYVWNTRDLSATLGEDLPLVRASNVEELREIMPTDYGAASNYFLRYLSGQGVEIVGLEPRTAILNKAREEEQMAVAKLPNVGSLPGQFMELSTSNVGMKVRNEEWVKTIEKIRAQDPDALIIVHGGAEHLLYDRLYSVPNLLGGRGYSFLLLDKENFQDINPVLSKFNDQEFLWRQFEQASDKGRYVLSFKPTYGTSQEVTPEQMDVFKKSLGADVVVVVKEVPAKNP